MAGEKVAKAYRFAKGRQGVRIHIGRAQYTLGRARTNAPDVTWLQWSTLGAIDALSMASNARSV